MNNIIIPEIDIQTLTNKQLVDFVSTINIAPDVLDRYIKNHYSLIYDELVKRTSFLQQSLFRRNSVSILARIYCLKHNLTKHPTCQNPKCNHFVKWDSGKFRQYCSLTCRSSDPSWQEKVKSTNKSKYGVEFLLQSNEYKQKAQITMFEHFGVYNPMQSQDLRDKQINSIKEHYGVDNPSKATEVKQAKVETCLRNYGVKYPLQSNQIKDQLMQQNLLIYGTNWYVQTEEFKSIYVQQCQEKYGVQNYAQSKEYHKTKRHKYHSVKYPGLTFDSTWEVKVYEFCRDNSIEVEYSPSITYKYEYDGRTWTYHPDFLINGKVYEVKGDNFFRINESTGKEEMYCPYGRKKFGEEKWNWLCGKFEAKHQCMVENNVTILRGKQVEYLSIGLFF